MFTQLEPQNMEIGGKQYQLLTRIVKHSSPDTPRLVIAAKLPEENTIPLLRLCIQCIRKFTNTDYELWVVDNNSPESNLEWLMDYPDINLVFCRTAPADNGSFENALALELASKLIDQSTKYFMCLHQDTAPCREGWLQYLLSKFDSKVRAVGVREDHGRVQVGVLHVLGYMIDFQLFKQLGLNFMPELPQLDVGDKAIVELKSAGYATFATRNSLWDKSVVDLIPENSPFRNFNVDRAIDDDGNVFFLHLGRGLWKSIGVDNNPEKTSVKLWQEFIEANLLND